MPAQKRSATEIRDAADWVHHHQAKQSRHDPEFEDAEPKEDPNDLRRRNHEGDDGEEAGAEEDSEGSPSSSSGDGDKPTDYPQFISLQLPEIRTVVMCPICLGIIKKTRTVMECLHRFCRECIDKSMRLGKNECPACRTHCASRRSLRDDPNYDALISALYPDIDKYEEQELAFHEEERKRNKQIQAIIAQISERQTEALARRRALGKDTAGGFTTRSQRSHARLRRQNTRNVVLQESEDDENENDNNEGQDSSSTDEQSTEIRQQQYRRRAGAQASQPSSSTSNSDGRCLENDLEGSGRISPRQVWTAEMLAWGRGGTRSNSRHSSSNNKNSQINRVSKLANYFRSLEQINYELDDVYVMLVSLDTKSAPSLQQPHLCCQPSYSVEHLHEYIACQIQLEPEDVEIVLMKEQDYTNEPIPLMGNSWQNELHILEGRETLGGLKARRTSYTDRLILGYRRKDCLVRLV